MKLVINAIVEMEFYVDKTEKALEIIDGIKATLPDIKVRGTGKYDPEYTGRVDVKEDTSRVLLPW